MRFRYDTKQKLFNMLDPKSNKVRLKSIDAKSLLWNAHRSGCG